MVRGQQPLGLPPVDTFHQHRQLCRGQAHFVITREWLGKTTSLKSFSQQAQATAGRPMQFNLPNVVSPENEDVAGYRVLF